MRPIYLDYAATTPVDLRVFNAMRPYFSEKFGNPGSMHGAGQEAINAVDRARESVANSIGAKFREIIFTASATEANNLALRGTLKAAQLLSTGSDRPLAPAASGSLVSRRADSFGDQARRVSETFRAKVIAPLRIIVSAIEHESILETTKDLSAGGGFAYGEAKNSVEVIYLPVNKEGLVDVKKLKALLNERTIIVSVMYANNEVGTIQPITKIAEIIARFKVEKLKDFGSRGGNKHAILQSFNQQFPLLHTDASQAFQYLDCDVNTLGVDLMTLSSHKIYGPKGMGGLYIRSGNNESGIVNNELGIKNSRTIIRNSLFINPIITGGGQEYGLRSGTENVPAIVGFGKAAALLNKYNKDNKEAERVKNLCDYFWFKLKKIKPNVEINGSAITIAGRRTAGEAELKRLPNNLNVYFPDASAEELLVKLDMLGIEASAGSACAARSLNESYVLRALGYGEKRAKSSIRFSLGRHTTKSDIDEALRRIKNIFTRLNF